LVFAVLAGESDYNVLALALGHFADFFRIDGISCIFEYFLVEREITDKIASVGEFEDSFLRMAVEDDVAKVKDIVTQNYTFEVLLASLLQLGHLHI